MSNWLKNVFITFGPRVIASAIGGLATYIGVKTSGAIQIDPTAAAATVTTILVSYAGTHKLLSSKINPGDSATGRVAEAIKDAADSASTVRVQPK